MRTIEEEIDTKVSSKVIWNAWKDIYHRQMSDHEKTEFYTGKKGFFHPQKGKPVPFMICDIREDESFTTVWKTGFIRLVFRYQVEPTDLGSKIKCKVLFKGFFSYPVSLLIRGSVKKFLARYLKEFSDKLENDNHSY